MAFDPHDAAIDLERFELGLFPQDPPPVVELWVDQRRLPFDLAGPELTPALIRVVERFGLPERPLVAARDESDDGEYQVLSGGTWLRAAREAGMDRVPVRVLEVSDLSGALLALVLNQQWAADVAAQADALQALLEAGVDEQDLARSSGLGRSRLRRLASLLELHPLLRQGLREGRIRPQLAFAAARLSPPSQDELAAVYSRDGELSSADLKRLGETGHGQDASFGEAGGGAADIEAMLAELQSTAVAAEDPAARARRQAEELLRTLEEAGIPADIRQRVAEVVEELGRIAV